MEGGGGGRGQGGGNQPGRGRGGGGGRNYGGGRGRGGGGYGGGSYDQNYQAQYREGGGGDGYGRGRNSGGGGGYDQNYQAQYRESGGYGGGGGGYGRGRNSGGGGGYDQNYQAQYRESGGYGGGGGYGRGRNSGGGGGYDQNYQSQYRESGGGGGRGGGRGRGYDSRPPQQQEGRGNGGGGGSGGRGVPKQWGPPQSAYSSDQPQPQQQVFRPPQPPIADSVATDFKSLKISEGLLPTLEKVDGKSLPIRRPDHGTLAVRKVHLYANHFKVAYDPKRIVMHYDVEIKQVAAPGNRRFKKSIPKHLMHAIKDKLFTDSAHQFPVEMVAYDGEKNIFSAVELPVGVFRVDFSDDVDASACSYSLTIKEVNRLELGKLKEYIGGKISYIPRDILQSLDLVMKDNPSKCRINVGKSFYCKNYKNDDDLGWGLAAYRGLNQSLKPTSQGLVLCLDYSVLAFRKPWPVLDFLEEHLGVRAEDIGKEKPKVFNALKGLKVTVTHRRTKQKYVVSGLTKQTTRELSFQLVSPDSSAPPETVFLADYFWQKYQKRIKYLDIPCLDIGKPGKPNHVPMEFCVLLEGQRYEKEELARLDKGYTAGILRNMSLANPDVRKHTINVMLQAPDGPCGAVAKNFDLEVEKNMTKVSGRVLGAPELKLRALNGNECRVTVDRDKCHWNLMRHSVPEGQHVERWALIDFTVYNGRSRLNIDEFIGKLKARSSKLGMHMEDPVVKLPTGMHDLSSVGHIKRLLFKVVDVATRKGCPQDNPLQLIVCVMSNRDPGYKILKWVSEVQIGIITQCCLSNNAARAQDQFLANLCLKINAKVGGSNVELNERLPHFSHEDSVMFIGADVNHPAASNSTCPSIAAVVGSINWPATNRYAAKIQPQAHRKEKILNFGSICRDLINTYAQHNGSKPKKIIVFRDGVSEGQFDMVLNEELVDMVKAISDEHYQPYITLVVAQKRHHTRLFAAGNDERSPVVNIPPGTVVDTKIVHPFEFDFYLCSHLGSIGTSKPTHYYVLWDDNRFTSDELQKLIYNLCFTYARCTKPVSLVPPVYYADLVAYRGRMFQEVAMLPPEPGKPPVAPSSFDHSFYTLHENLRDVMHFI